MMHRLDPISYLSKTGDMEMWLRTAAVSDIGRVDGPDQLLHRDHPASWHGRRGAHSRHPGRRQVFASSHLLRWFRGAVAVRERVARDCEASAGGRGLEAACHPYDPGRTEVFRRRWWALQRRRWIGSAAVPFMPIFFPRIVWHGLRHRFHYHPWAKTGI
jgi:hypothetical protein